MVYTSIVQRMNDGPQSQLEHFGTRCAPSDCRSLASFSAILPPLPCSCVAARVNVETQEDLDAKPGPHVCCHLFLQMSGPKVLLSGVGISLLYD